MTAQAGKPSGAQLLRLLVAALYTGALALMLCVLGGLQGILLRDFYQRSHSFPIAFNDFLKYYALGQIIHSPQYLQVYDRGVQLAFFNQLVAPAHLTEGIYVQLPPFAVASFAILPYLSTFNAYCLWIGVTTVLGLAALALIMKGVRNYNLFQIGVVLLAVLASVPGWRSHFVGQWSWWTLACLALFAWAFVKNKDILTGLGLALSTVKFQYSIFFLVPILAERRWRALVAFAIIELIFLAAAAPVIGWQNVINYPHVLLAEEVSNERGLQTQIMVSLRGPLSLWFSQSAVVSACSVLALVSLAALWWFWRKVRNASGQPTEQLSWLCAITVLCLLVFSPHIHHYDCLLLGIVAVLTLPCLNPVDVMRVRSAPLRCFAWILMSYPFASMVIVNIAAKNEAGYFLFTAIDVVLLVLALVHVMLLKGAAKGDGAVVAAVER